MSLEEEVAGLTTATTDLLQAVNVSKAALDQAVIDAGQAAITAGTVYVDEPTGRAAVEDGDTFLVQGTDSDVAILLYRRLSSTTSEFITSYASAASVRVSKKNGYIICGEFDYKYFDLAQNAWIVSHGNISIMRGAGLGTITVLAALDVVVPMDRAYIADITGKVAGDTVTAFVTPTDFAGSSYGEGAFVNDFQLPLFAVRTNGISGLLSGRDHNEFALAKTSPWFGANANTTVSYDVATRTLSWDKQIVCFFDFENGRRSFVLEPFSITLPVSNYVVAYIDMRTMMNSTGVINTADVVKFGKSTDVLTDPNAYIGRSYQVPIFYHGYDTNYGPVNGFFEREITGVYYPYDPQRIIAVEQALDNVDTLISDSINSVRSDIQSVSYHYEPLTSFDDTSSRSTQVDINGIGIGGPEVTKALLDKINTLEDEVDNGQVDYNEESLDPVAAIDGVIKKSTATGLTTYMDMSPEVFVDGWASYRGKAIMGVLNRPVLGTTVPVAIGGAQAWIKTRIVLPSGKKLMMVIISFGQSNSVGAQAYTPPTVLTQNKHASTLLMAGGPGFMDVRFGLPSGAEAVGSETVLNASDITNLKPLISLQSQLLPSQGATALESMAYTFADAVSEGLGIQVPMVIGAAGWGGRFQTALAKGSIPYQNFMTALTKIKQLANEKGYEIYVPFVPIIHGESDSTRSEYLEGIKTWQADFNADIKAITGQLANVPFLCTQASTFQGGASTNGVLAPYYASKESPSLFHLASPYYPYDLVDDLLHMGQSGIYLGEKMAHAAARITGIWGEHDFGTVRPISITYNGTNTIDVLFNVPTAPLVRDTTDLTVNSPAPADWGFRIRDGSGVNVPISSITIVGGNTVRIVTSAAPAPGGFRSVDYAMIGFGGTKVRGEQARGQLRDSTSIKSIYQVEGQEPKTLYDWCNHFREFF